MSATAASIAVIPDQVYPGLRPFRRDESILFFGRQEHVDDLLGRLEDTSFLAVVGLSGGGKSSLVLAGLAAGCNRAQPTLAGGKPVTHWTTAIRDPDPKVRKEAAAKLGNVGPADPSALPALMGALKDPAAMVRRAFSMSAS